MLPAVFAVEAVAVTVTLDPSVAAYVLVGERIATVGAVTTFTTVAGVEVVVRLKLVLLLQWQLALLLKC